MARVCTIKAGFLLSNNNNNVVEKKRGRKEAATRLERTSSSTP